MEALCQVLLEPLQLIRLQEGGFKGVGMQLVDLCRPQVQCMAEIAVVGT